MTDKLEALSQPVRIRHDWNSATMAHCGKCDQWEMTIADAEGVQTCASCYDAEWLSEWQGYAEALEQRAVSLLAALEEKDMALKHSKQTQLTLAENLATLDDALKAQVSRAEAAEQREDRYRQRWVDSVADLDVAGKRIAELEQRLQQPIKLRKCDIGIACEFISEHVVVSLAAVMVEAATAGFKVEVEGE